MHDMKNQVYVPQETLKYTTAIDLSMLYLSVLGQNHKMDHSECRTYVCQDKIIKFTTGKIRWFYGFIGYLAQDKTIKYASSKDLPVLYLSVLG